MNHLSTADRKIPRLAFLLMVAMIVPSGMCVNCLSEQPKSFEQSVDFIVGDYLESEGGEWMPDDSPLRGPFGVDFDEAGSMYIVELDSGRLLKRGMSGEIQVLRDTHEKAYDGDGNNIAKAFFNGPHNCVIDKDNHLLIADSWNHCVRSIDLNTMKVETIAGTGQEGFSGDSSLAVQAEFNFVMCIELSPSGNLLHITDLKNRRVRNLDLTTGVVQSVAGNGERGKPIDGSSAVSSPLMDPRAAASDNLGNLYILERNGNSLRVVRDDGKIYTVAGTGKKGWKDGEATQAWLGSPKHICCDPTGNVYIADDTNASIRKYDPSQGTLTTILGRGFGDPKITLKRAHGVRWHKESLYVVDTANNRVLRIASP